MKRNTLTSPGSRQVGDCCVKIGNTDLHDLEVEAIRELLKGPLGTQVLPTPYPSPAPALPYPTLPCTVYGVYGVVPTLGPRVGQGKTQEAGAGRGQGRGRKGRRRPGGGGALERCYVSLLFLRWALCVWGGWIRDWGLGLPATGRGGGARWSAAMDPCCSCVGVGGMWIRDWGLGFGIYEGGRRALERCDVSLLLLRCRGGLVFKARRLLYHSTLGLRVIKTTKSCSCVGLCAFGVCGLWIGG